MDDDSVLESFQDALTSDGYSPEPKQVRCMVTFEHGLDLTLLQSKPKAFAAKKAAGAAPKTKPAPKKMSQTTLKTTKPAPKKRAKPTSDDENTENDSQDDDSLQSNTPPSAKRQKKASAPKKSGGIPLANIENESFEVGGANETRNEKPRNDQYEQVKPCTRSKSSAETDIVVAHATGAYSQATRYLYWLRRTNNRQDVGVQFAD